MTFKIKTKSDLDNFIEKSNKIVALKEKRSIEIKKIQDNIHLCYQLGKKDLEYNLKELLKERIIHWNNAINNITF